ncbi:MAG TPA: carboxypeptidase-like regulatory domain-containing protein, partial [Bryobacteraceae bacterium]|nr:carboxypeptidase-like regulatory domain-containing protein [Bryobacteraceae bacterium]
MNHTATFKLWIFAAVLLAAAAVFPELLRAQAVSGDLVGIVTDATGAAVPNATVVATNDATGVKTAATTDTSGSYRLANLPV